MKKAFWSVIIPCSGMLILILDTKTALVSAAEGISLCLWTLIPSLFPFILLSKLLISAMLGRKLPIFGKLCRILNIPEGTESIFLVGALGGYPIGAQCISQAYRQQAVSKESAERMIAFCSNAGPAFMFGIGSRLFEDQWMCWALWAVHILSAIIMSYLLPRSKERGAKLSPSAPVSLTQALKSSLQTMAIICGWVVMFRIILAFCQSWFLWALPEWAQFLLAGFLELSNGCCALTQLADINVRFVLFSAFLGFGGVCVIMQTKSVCDGMNIKNYILGKLSQSAISILLAAAIVYSNFRLHSLLIVALLLSVKYFYNKKFSKALAIYRKEVYNTKNTYAR